MKQNLGLGLLVALTMNLAGSASINQDTPPGMPDTLQQINMPPKVPFNQPVSSQSFPVQSQSPQVIPTPVPMNQQGTTQTVFTQPPQPSGIPAQGPVVTETRPVSTELSVLSGAIVEFVIGKKAFLVQTVANLLQLILGSSAITFGRLMATMMGVPMAPPTAQQANQRSSQSGPQYPNDPVQDTGMNFILPVLNRPIRFQDFQVLERLVVESLDVYNKWQKKSSGPTQTAAQPRPTGY